MTDLTYSARPHLFSGAETYELEDDGLSVQAGGASARHVPYAGIESVRLIAYAGADGQQQLCTLETRGHGKLTVRSHHFVSLGVFEDRSADYGAFLRELFRRVHAANPDARFISGSTGLQIAWLIVLVLAALAGLVWIAVAFESPSDILGIVSAFGILAAAVLLGVRYFRASKVTSFDPLNPPLP